MRTAARRLLALVVVVAVLAAVGVTGREAWLDGRLNGIICGGDCGPEFITAPDGLAAAAPARPAPPPTESTAVDPDAVLAAVADELDADALGPHVGFAAASVDPDGPVVTRGDGTFVPASTTKLLTALAASHRIPAGTRFTTSVVDAGDDGVVLVGGGDPYLTLKRDGESSTVQRAALADLADDTAEALRSAGRDAVAVGFDDGLFAGPSINPDWESDYVPGQVVTPITALWVDQGIRDGARDRRPAVAAGERFADLLRSRGIEVTGDVERVDAPAGAPDLAVARSATAAQIIEMLIRVSDNEAAEVMLRHVALATGAPATFAGGAGAVVEALDDLGVDTDGLQLFDGSGLSRRNQISPTTLVEVVRRGLSTPGAAAVVDDLPVSGFSGSLSSRFARADAGLVQAKTGTLTGIRSLAGYAIDADGRPVVFAVMIDRVDRAQTFASQLALDDVAAAIVDCSCGAAGAD